MNMEWEEFQLLKIVVKQQVQHFNVLLMKPTSYLLTTRLLLCMMCMFGCMYIKVLTLLSSTHFYAQKKDRTIFLHIPAANDSVSPTNTQAQKSCNMATCLSLSPLLPRYPTKHSEKSMTMILDFLGFLHRYHDHSMKGEA